jgi:hypothetical protein
MLLGFPCVGWCCEPIIPLAHLLAGATLAGPAMLTKSLLWLSVAVAVKSVSFVFFERRISWSRAILFMILANVVSTIPGVMIAILSSSIPLVGTLLSLPLVALLGWIVQRRFAAFPQNSMPRRISSGAAMLAFVGFYIISMVLYGVAVEVLDGGHHSSYWIVKFFFVTLVACTGIMISAVLEEGVIARLSRKTTGNLFFYHSVFRANYVTLMLVLLVAALELLPRRLHSSGFLASWLNSILTLIRVS